MTVFILSLAYGVLSAGSFILFFREGYKGWTWFWKNYDRLPHLYRSHWRYQKRFIFKRIWRRLFNR
ncbi:hypothetical protein IIL84_004779 [Escherichia coli]|nr:hypothetical protein [Escherichia coli]EGK8619607.1 hypothetical protein [Escherichia coli]EGN2330582.1 hypothetical protein [Escherichia coli]EHR1020860.1 hypothetical protein [Escherichia coli]EIH1768797.1 hypothetical protein [Escherichia coli]